jgi:oligopeptide/dipeptide ABC transporter ATP-binding protein
MSTPASVTDGTPPALLDVRGLKKYFVHGSALFWKTRRIVRAVDGISFKVLSGQVVGLVGESGCGKTTTGRMLVRLDDPTEGEILFDGVNLASLKGLQLRTYRRRIQMIFQDPYASLDPRMRIGESISEPLALNGGSAAECRERAADLLDRVGLPTEFSGQYPSQLSGGQRQRVGIARALALEPSIIVADEPTSSLDVSVRAQVINLLRDLQQDAGLSLIFVSHDLSTVRYISDSINVMYLGKIVEQASSEDLFQHPLHPYTQALLAAIPIPDPELESARPEQLLAGDLPSPMRPPSGCSFHTRCPLATARCRVETPELRDFGNGHSASCHLL